MASQDDKITVTMTREEIERLIQILNAIFRRDSDVEHFLTLLSNALHGIKRTDKPAAVS